MPGLLLVCLLVLHLPAASRAQTCATFRSCSSGRRLRNDAAAVPCGGADAPPCGIDRCCIANSCFSGPIAPSRDTDYAACLALRSGDVCTPGCLRGFLKQQGGGFPIVCGEDGKFQDASNTVCVMACSHASFRCPTGYTQLPRDVMCNEGVCTSDQCCESTAAHCARQSPCEISGKCVATHGSCIPSTCSTIFSSLPCTNAGCVWQYGTCKDPTSNHCTPLPLSTCQLTWGCTYHVTPTATLPAVQGGGDPSPTPTATFPVAPSATRTASQTLPTPTATATASGTATATLRAGGGTARRPMALLAGCVLAVCSGVGEATCRSLSRTCWWNGACQELPPPTPPPGAPLATATYPTTPCEQLSQTECAAQGECTWLSGSCRVVVQCPTANKATCMAAPDCVWVAGRCTSQGTPDCTAASEGACTSTRGCLWNKPLASCELAGAYGTAMAAVLTGPSVPSFVDKISSSMFLPSPAVRVVSETPHANGTTTVVFQFIEGLANDTSATERAFLDGTRTATSPLRSVMPEILAPGWVVAPRYLPGVTEASVPTTSPEPTQPWWHDSPDGEGAGPYVVAFAVVLGMLVAALALVVGWVRHVSQRGYYPALEPDREGGVPSALEKYLGIAAPQKPATHASQAITTNDIPKEHPPPTSAHGGGGGGPATPPTLAAANGEEAPPPLLPPQHPPPQISPLTPPRNPISSAFPSNGASSPHMMTRTPLVLNRSPVFAHQS